LKSESSQEIILEKDEAPEDKYNLIYFTMMVYGVAMLAPWNAVLSTMHFYKEELPGTNIDFMIAFAMNGIMIFVVLACVFFTKDKLANGFSSHIRGDGARTYNSTKVSRIECDFGILGNVNSTYSYWDGSYS
jgi:hypothetical protein